MLSYTSEYDVLQSEDDYSKRKTYWSIAKGLQKTDGLETSSYLETIIDETLNNKYDSQIAQRKVEQYYQRLDVSDPAFKNRTAEADIVAARINTMLGYNDFSLSPTMLRTIHQELFDGILLDGEIDSADWAGVYRKINLEKSQEIINGDTVAYANFLVIPDRLAQLFRQELDAEYRFPWTEEQVSTFGRFISRVWQVHPFREGNTRTVSTFMLKYLRSMGVEVTNEPLQDNAEWFRNSLVRSVYLNSAQNINAESRFLDAFLENLIGIANHNISQLNLFVTPEK